MYALSQVLTMPEPDSLLLIAVGLAACCRRRR
ncbi:MAG: PEP-CTERM sorting domain-containing protein [Phycisphaeraceae bacterium]|nr:PEP-CTERM sorting domain-containing protein [Phycisphaeraceae bacterium]